MYQGALLLLAFVSLLKTSLSTPEAFCVKTQDTKDGHCKVQEYQCKECHLLIWYIKNPRVLSNSVLYFLPGSHKLSENALNISHVTNFSLVGSKVFANDDPQSQIFCTHHGGGVLFFNSENVNMTNITISHCGITVQYYPDNFSVHAAVSFRSSFNVTLSGIVITHSIGLGLHVDRVNGYIRVRDSKFMYSKGSSCQKFVANARFYYGYDSRDGSSLLIENCFFLNGNSSRNIVNDKPDSSGLLILIYAPSIQVKIRNITAKSNYALRGGNIGVLITFFHENTSTVSITDSNIISGRSKRGGGLICYIEISHGNPKSCQIANKTHTIAFIRGVNFNDNSADSGGAVYIHQQQLKSIDCMLQRIVFTNCTFQYNDGVRGMAVAIIKFLAPGIWVHNAVQFDVTFRNCRFFKNKHMSKIKENSKASVVMLLQADSVNVSSSTFSYNDGTAISLVNSNLIFEGFILFEYNTAIHGGALNLCDSSLIYLSPHTHVKLVGNKAKVSGGGTFAEQRRLDSDPPCFFQPLVNTSLNMYEIKEQVQFEYINNSAGIAGDAIYGGSVDNCFTIEHFKLIKYKEMFHAIHNLEQQSGHSPVTSDPTNIILCNQQTWGNFESQNKTVHVFSGEQFSLSLSAVGQMNGLVPASISISPNNKSATARVNAVWPKHDPKHLCRTVNLTVSSNSSIVTLEFSLEYTSTASWSDATSSHNKPPQVTVIVKDDCPWIFKRNEAQSCDCAPVLHQHVKCSITDQSFNRGDKSVWVGCQYNNDSFTNESSCDLILLSENCPEELCTNTVEWLKQDNSSKQCQDGREGILCGKCRNGFSLTLGSQDCVSNDQCPLWKLPILLLVFVIVGLLLVLFLTVFNFTVSQGTMYGLIFYANVVHANQKTLLTNCLNFFRIFIAWLSLDFGFNVCFYTGMDAYQKVWLEFGFVLYLLSIAVVIVYLSHKLIFVTRLVGRNIVNVLSTILLLSFISAARTAIKSLHYIDLTTSSEKSLRVWYYDGNIGYLQGKHIPLALVSILVLTIVSLYMFSLLFIQCLQRRSGWCVLRWVNKLRPFFDAYTGPCRDQYRFWPGFLLFVLLAIFSLHVPVHIAAKNQLYIALAFCVLVFVLACISPHGVYKKWPLNVLDFSFLLNLGSLCLIVTNNQNLWFSSVSIGIAVLTFVLILVFHGYQRVSGTRKWQKLVRRCRRKPFTYLSINKTREREDDVYSNIVNQEVNEQTPLLGIPPTVHFTALREPLLSSND